MNKRSWFQAGWPPVVAILLLLSAWHYSTIIFKLEKWFLPSPVDIVKEAITNFDRVWLHTEATILITLLGMAVGVSIGIITAVLLHSVPFVHRALYPLLILSQNIPMVVLAPLLTIWFGFGVLPKLIVITLVCFFPVVIAMISGLGSPDRIMYNYMRMIGANRRQLFFKLELPSSLPSFFTGLKISGTYAVMGAIFAEMVGTDRGIGVYMLLAKSAFRIDRLFVAIFVIMALSLLLFSSIVILEKLVIRWKPPTESQRKG